MPKRLSTFFIALLLLSTLVTAFHHHDDGADHPDCPICITHHQQSTAELPSSACIVHRDFAETAFVTQSRVFHAKTVFTPANNRAPPA